MTTAPFRPVGGWPSPSRPGSGSQTGCDSRAAAWDANNDGAISKQEVPRLLQVRLSAGSVGRFHFFDDIDEEATKTTAAHRSAGPLWFRRMDVNGDGDVSRREWLGSEEDFRRIDTDGDGLISLEEAIKADEWMRKGPLTAEDNAKSSAQRADVLGTGDQPNGRIAGPGLDRRDLQLGARADRPSAALPGEESIHHSLRFNATALARLRHCDSSQRYRESVAISRSTNCDAHTENRAQKSAGYGKHQPDEKAHHCATPCASIGNARRVRAADGTHEHAQSNGD